jgi:hypothetical protein
MPYLIWSDEHEAWWRPDHRGYTTDVNEAGAYTFYEAAEIVVDHVPPGEEISVKVPPGEDISVVGERFLKGWRTRRQ